MSLGSSMLLVFSAGMLVAVIGAPAPAAASVDEHARAQLRELSSRSFFFAHQSVGDNLLDGLRQLAAEGGAPIPVVATSDAAQVRKGTFAHTTVGRNGEPAGKIDEFARIMRAGMGEVVDVAFVKFCYVDVNARTDVERLFSRYQSVLRELKTQFPRVTFVHLTVPLMTQDTATKAIAKRVLGRGDRLEDNARREAYNSLVRRAYAGKEPLFDLARAESTAPDGSRATARWKGEVVPVLVPAYSDDGGHLNRAASKGIARQLVTALSGAKSGE